MLSVHCVFCAHGAEEGLDSPAGRVCSTCVTRIATLARLGGEVATACWAVVLSDERRALALLVDQELAALGNTDSQAARSLEQALAELKLGHAAAALDRVGAALVYAPTGPVAQRALGLLLGPMLKPGGVEALRAALFRT